MRRRSLSLLAGVLVLAACGGGSSEPAADAPTGGATVTTAASQPAATGDVTTAPADADVGAGDTTSTATSEVPAVTTAPGSATPDTTVAGEPPATTEAAPATTAAPADVRAPDGCSADNSPGATDVADGPVPQIEVRAASQANPLPDVAVRRINCAGGWVNIKNEVPGDLPVLIWLWAPH